MLKRSTSLKTRVGLGWGRTRATKMARAASEAKDDERGKDAQRVTQQGRIDTIDVAAAAPRSKAMKMMHDLT